MSVSILNGDAITLQVFVAKTSYSLNNINIQKSVICDMIKVLMVNKVSGQTLISHKMLKMTFGTTDKSLQILFDRSLTEGIFLHIGRQPLLCSFSKRPPRRAIKLSSCLAKYIWKDHGKS